MAGKKGAPYRNQNASKGAKLESVLNAILSEMDDEAGLPDGSTNKTILKAYIEDAKTNAQGRIDYINRRYGKPRESIDVTADITDRRVEELSDEELLAIVLASRAGDPDEAAGATDAAGVH